MSMTDMPPELLVHILSLLEHTDILRSQLISKLFHDIVHTSIKLQYFVELAVSGYMDGCIQPELSTEERLRLLRVNQSVWKQPFDLEEVKTIPLPDGNTRYFEFSGGWVTRVYKPLGGPSGFWADMRIGVTHLESNNLVETSWQSGVDFNPTRIAIDPSQDLIVVALPPDNFDYADFQLISLLQGTPHPGAFSHQMRITLPGYIYLSCRELHILGNLLAVKLEGHSLTGSEIIIVDWRARTPQMRLTLPADTILGLCMLSTQYFILGRCQGDDIPRIWIELYKISDSAPDGTHESLYLTPRLVATYELPRLAKKRRIWLSLQCTAPHTTLQTESPFNVSPLGGLVHMQFSVDRPDGNKNYRIFTPISTFLPRNIRRNTELWTEPITHPWEAWGPKSTRWFPCVTLALYTPKVHGYRFIDSRSIYDFTPLEIARNLLHQAQPAAVDTSTEALPTPDKPWSKIVTTATSMPSRGIFAHSVKSMLPFRHIDFGEEFPVDTGLFSHDRFVKVEVDELGVPTAMSLLRPLRRT